MISGIKICGVSDIKTLNYIINHPSPPQYVGFITNYKKSKRYVNYETLKQLTSVKKKKNLFQFWLDRQMIFWKKLKI